MDTINANTRTTILLCLVSLAIATLVGLITSRLLVKQILNMIHAAKALSRGNWQQQLSEPQSHELALLAKAFNRMAGHLQTSFTQLEHNAHHDALTGLLNPTAFKMKLEEAIARCAQTETGGMTTGTTPSHQFAVLFLDLDHFKLVNDSLGHLVGDQLLISCDAASG